MLSAGATVGVTEPMIEDLVRRFYGRVRQDALLGPIFEGAIHDWEEHFAKLSDFWSSVTLGTGRYDGRPMPVHVKLPGVEAEHFDRWLGLFRQTASEVCPTEAAALFMDRAERIAQSFRMGISLYRENQARIDERLAAGSPPKA